MPTEPIANAVKVGLFAAVIYAFYRLSAVRPEQEYVYTPERVAEARRRYGY